MTSILRLLRFLRIAPSQKVSAPPWPRRVVVLVVSAIVLLVLMSYFATRNQLTQAEQGNWVLHTQEVRFQLAKILQTLVDLQAQALGATLDADDSAEASYRNVAAHALPQIAQLKVLIADNARQVVLVEKLSRDVKDLLVVNNDLIKAIQSQDAAQIRLITTEASARQLMIAARSAIEQMQGEEDRLLVERRQASRESRLYAILSLWATAALGVVLIVFVVYVARRDQERVRRVERELATTLRSIGDAVIATDVCGLVRFMNPIAEELTGWGESDAKGKPLSKIFQVIDENTRLPLEDMADQVLKAGRTFSLSDHAILLGRDGSEHAVADSGAPIIDEQGLTQGMVLVFRDVSEKRATQRALQLRDTELQIINDYAKFPIARIGTDYRYLFVNRAYAERMGLTTETCVGKTITEVVGESAFIQVKGYLDEAFTGETLEFELEIPYRGLVGTRWMHCIYAPARSGTDSAVSSVVAAVTDITERKQAEESLRRSQAALQNADHRKDEFLATLSHELRNPLAPIRTAAMLLNSATISTDQLGWAQKVIQRQVGHMALLLDDLLDIARVTQGKLELRKATVLLKDILEPAIEAMRPIFEEKKHQLKVDIPAADQAVFVDPLRLSQVISNLLANAAKYTDNGGIIELSARILAKTLTIAVKDNGIGIAANSLQDIFEMFSQVEGAAERSQGGLGIGLALVRGIVELHGGTVSVKSAGLSRGSQFLVQIPMVCDVSPPKEVEAVSVSESLEGRQILVADDNIDAADSLGMLLEMENYSVRVAHSGTGAIALAKESLPDVALLDIGMPDMSGYAVAKAIRLLPGGDKIRLIALTGWGQEKDRKEAQAAGFDEHLTKPVDPDRLLALLITPSKA